MIELSWNDAKSLEIECPTCKAPAGEWCVYVKTVHSPLAPWGDPSGTRNHARMNVGKRTKRLHNDRRPKYDENGQCRYWYETATDPLESDPVRCTARPGERHQCYLRDGTK